MFRDEAVARIQQRLGFRTDKSAEILAELQSVQADLEKAAELPWFLIQEILTESTTAGEERVAVPTDFLREYEEDALYYYNADPDDEAKRWVPLKKGTREANLGNYPGTGAPAAYSLDGGYFRIRPLPDDVYPLKILCYTKDAVLSSNIENRWLAHASDLLIGKAGEPIAMGLRDMAARDFFRAEVQRATLRLHSDTITRAVANQSFAMGGED